MQKIKLGATDLEVSRICLGTWQFGGEWGAIDEDDAVATVARARELGIDFFDTAQAYGFGASEDLLARALRGVPREDVVLATKGGLRKEGGELLRDSSPAWLRAGLEASLRHLGTDYVDLYQVHWPDPGTPFSETAAALEQFVREGKVRYVGASNFDALQIAEFAMTRRLDALQPPYHMLRREIEDAVLPYCREHDVGVLAYGPLAHGLLSGNFTRDSRIAEDDWRAGSDLFGGANFERNLEIVERLEELARELGITVAQLAIAWTLANPAVHVAIVGARRPAHIEGTAPAADVRLDSAAMARIEEILGQAVAVGGPTPEG
jgi:aryl-alcohol dehydrogenase-like predicted oxidoreductase